MQQLPSIPAAPSGATQEFNNDINLPKPPSSWKSILSTVGILVAAPVIALALTALVFQSYEVDGPSMETTLHNRDRLIVWKLPRTLAKVTKRSYIPKRNDVIIFVKHGLSESTNNKDKQLIKRVIGLPGERVVVSDGHITIYNPRSPQGFNPDSGHEYSANISQVTTGNIDITVPDDEVFVSGDNRTNSLDSRSFGTVPATDIVGKLTFRIFPASNFKSFL